MLIEFPLKIHPFTPIKMEYFTSNKYSKNYSKKFFGKVFRCFRRNDFSRKCFRKIYTKIFASCFVNFFRNFFFANTFRNVFRPKLTTIVFIDGNENGKDKDYGQVRIRVRNNVMDYGMELTGNGRNRIVNMVSIQQKRKDQ